MEVICTLITNDNYEKCINRLNSTSVDDWERSWTIKFTVDSLERTSFYRDRQDKPEHRQMAKVSSRDYTSYGAAMKCITYARHSGELPHDSRMRISANHIFRRKLNDIWMEVITFTRSLPTQEVLHGADGKKLMQSAVKQFSAEYTPLAQSGFYGQHSFILLTKPDTDISRDEFESWREATQHTMLTKAHLAILQDAADLLGRYDTFIFKKLIPNPISLTRKIWRDKSTDFSKCHVLPKTDGLHVMFYNIHGTFHIFDGTLHISGKSDVDEVYLLEGEYIDNPTKMLKIFDIFYLRNESMLDQSYVDIIPLLPKAVAPFLLLTAADETSTKIAVEDKSPILAEKLTPEIAKKMSSGEGVDGLIIYAPTPLDPEALRRPARQIFKWKPSNKLTIDFYAREIPEQFRSKYGVKTGYYLFNYVARDMLDRMGIKRLEEYDMLFDAKEFKTLSMVPIQFSPISVPFAYIWETTMDGLSGRIVELIPTHSADGAKHGWTFDRIREDKESDIAIGLYGNYFMTAEDNYLESMAPLSLDQLFGGADDVESDKYFKNNADVAYRPMTYANSLFKAMFFEKINGVRWLIDLAGGRADISRYRDNRIQNVLMIDKDEAAMVDVSLRRQQHRDKDRWKNNDDTPGGSNSWNTAISYLHADLTESISNYIPQLTGYGLPMISGSTKNSIKFAVDAISCNMAIHYFIESIDNFILWLKLLLKDRGYFFFTCFDGVKVQKLLAQSGRWEAYEGDRLKYQIVARYDYKTQKANTDIVKVGVLMPFSNGELYDEPLVNIDRLIALLGAQGFMLIERLDNKCGEKVSNASEQDKFYSSLYCGCLFKLSNGGK
jgi:hypothetical protein